MSDNNYSHVKINACLSIYNEGRFIENAVRSVSWCDRVIVVDGAYVGYPTLYPQSTDGTRKILESLQKDIPQLELVFLEEFIPGQDKLNMFKDMIEIDEYILLLDGDEHIVTGSTLVRGYIHRNPLPLYSFPLFRMKIDNTIKQVPQYIARIFQNIPDLRITTRHMVLTNNFSPKYKVLAYGKLRPFRANMTFLLAVHHTDHRTQKRKDQKKEWVQYRKQHLLDFL